MTGKEALEKLLDTLKHWQGRNTIFDKIHSKHILDELELLNKLKEENEFLKAKLELYQGALHSENEAVHRANDLEDKLTKCKRAFEILKKYKLFILKKDKEIDFYEINTLSRAEWLEKEEYELLEELMKSE